jgi:hypothetical protein
VRRLADPLEVAAAPVEDVVGVDPVEMGGSRMSDEGGLGEELHAGDALAERRPVRIRDVERVVDVEAPDPERSQVLEV